MEEDHTVFVHLLDGVGLIVAQVDSTPGHGNYPTHFWQVGEAIADEHIIRVPRRAFAPNWLYLGVGLYDRATGVRLRPTAPDTVVGSDHVLFGEVSLVRPGSPHGGVPVRESFDNLIALVGYDLDTRLVRPGGTLHLTLYWNALKPVGTDYTVFVHMLAEDSSLAAQHDGYPADGASPTSTWLPGATVVDTHGLAIDQDAPEGVYVLQVGLYDGWTGERLPLLDDQQQYRDTRVVLSKLRVAVVD